MADYDLTAFSDSAVRKIIFELDIPDIARFLLDKDQTIRKLFAVNMKEKDRVELLDCLDHPDRDDAETYREGKERTERVISYLIEQGDITPAEIGK